MKLSSKLYRGLLLTGLLMGVFAGYGQPKKETVDKIKEVLKEIADLKAAGKKDDDQKIKDLAKKAIHMIDTAYHVPADYVNEEPVYNTGTEECEKEGVNGYAEPTGADGKKVKVYICPKGLTQSPGRIASTKVHEMVGHGRQAAAGNWYTDPKWTNIQEIEAIYRQLADSTNHGLTQDEIKERLDKIEEYKNTLDEANKTKVENKEFVKTIQAPKEGSKKEVSLKTAVYVTGKVYKQERMTVTLKNQNTIEGLVIKTEMNGNTIETRTDKNGNAILDFSALAGGTAITATALIKVFDGKGQLLEQTTTTVEPGVPMILNRPVCEKLPANMQSNSEITIPGRNLGAEAKLVIGNQIQETLAAADREMIVNCEAPTGTQPAYVITPNGVSESQKVNIYTLDFNISKTNINPGEKIQGQVHYESMPVGTKLIFTNHTQGIISISIKGAAKSGAKLAYKITSINGTIPVMITGVTQGGFSVSVDPEFRNK